MLPRDVAIAIAHLQPRHVTALIPCGIGTALAGTLLCRRRFLGGLVSGPVTAWIPQAVPIVRVRLLVHILICLLVAPEGIQRADSRRYLGPTYPR